VDLSTFRKAALDRFEAMSMLLAVVDNGSFSAAGRALRVPVATLTRKVSDLERLVGARLLIRTTRKLTLTDAGIGYVARARRIVEQVEEAERDAAGEFVMPKGELVISASMTFGRVHVLPIIADFLAQFPEINIRLALSDRNVDLLDDRVDLAVRIGELPDSEMVATGVGSMRTVVCAAPRLLDAYGIPKRPEDLLNIPCVSFEGPAPAAGWRFAPVESEVAVKPRLSVSTVDAAVQAALEGIGVTRLLYYQVVEAVKRNELKIVLQPFEPIPAPVHLLHVAHRVMPLKMRRFLDFAAPRLRRAIDEMAAE
jgi:DNA-binding transcriptional LysR family regulator